MTISFLPNAVATRPSRHPTRPRATALDPTLDPHLVASLLVSSTGFGLFDPFDRLRQANPVFLESFATTLDGEPSWEVMLRTCHANRRGLFIESDDIEAWITAERRQHRQGPSRSYGAQLVDGRRVWINETLQSDGWLLMIVSDISTMKAEAPAAGIAPIGHIAPRQIDVLTGLPNRRYIFQRLDALIATTRELRVPLSIAVLEIDHLRTLMGHHGVPAGDRVLEHFAGQLQRHLRPQDEAGRIGDDDFLLLLPNTSAAGADEALSRLRARLTESLTAPDAGLPGYSFSGGVAPLLAEDDASDFFTRADGALYLAKERGRGRQEVVTAEQLRSVG